MKKNEEKSEPKDVKDTTKNVETNEDKYRHLRDGNYIGGLTMPKD
jgi:hypothetical protein